MPRTELRDQQLIALMLAASLASTIGGLPFNALPILLGSLADSFALDAASVGMIGSVCFTGYLVGTLGAPLWMPRINWRWLTLVGAAGTAASFSISAFFSHLHMLYVVWAMIGFFASTMTCLGMRILSDLPNKVRAFGVRQGVELGVTAAVLFVVPSWIIAHFKYPGAALALAGLIAVLSLSAAWLPSGPAAAESPSPAAPVAALKMPPPAVWGLVVFFLFLVGNIGLWAFLERLGTSLHTTPDEMGIVFAVLKLLGGVAAFCMAAIGDRLRPQWAPWVVLTGLVIGLALLWQAQGFALYAMGAWLWEFAFTCGCVYQTAMIARHDPSGRAVLLVPAAFALGSMAGPGLAGQLVGTGNYGWVLGLALLSSTVPALARLWAWRR